MKRLANIELTNNCKADCSMCPRDALKDFGFIDLQTVDDIVEHLQKYDLSEVSYRLALDEYNKSTIKSPVTGIIDDVMPNIGEYVSPGTEVARLIDMSKLKIYVYVPENDVKYLRLGQTVDVYVAEIGGEKNIKQGVINYISVVSDSASNLTHKVRVDIALDRDIRPGRIVRVDIVRKTFHDVMVADMYAVIDKDGQKVVFVNNNGTAEERKVSDSMVETVHMVRPNHMNAAGRLFGGMLMQWLDEVAGMVAKRHTRSNVITASVDNLHFIHGAYQGEMVVIIGKVTYVGNSSMEVRVDTYVEHLEDGMRHAINRAYFTMVALDENDKPKRVPRLILETEAEKAEWEAAEKRREMRMRRKQEGF